ncbi:MAG TPA: nitroreductase family deazaflavin-dependent oxidoreductase [Ktedonobacteraceae bacterium]|nr:nitroreductase family deazaflavin-dependent oxidoreductase [Ktedonobacteraceae bacterium]
MKPNRTKGETRPAPASTWQWQRLYNPFVIALLRSPLHRLFDAHTLLLTVTGRRSGKSYTFPVSYVREGEAIWVISQRDRSWWKNLRGAAPVVVFVQGYTWQARGEALSDSHMAAAILLQLLQSVPAYQRLLHLQLDATGKPEDPEALNRLAEKHIVVRIRELAELAA